MSRGAIGIVGSVVGLGGVVICASVMSNWRVGFEGFLPARGSI